MREGRCWLVVKLVELSHEKTNSPENEANSRITQTERLEFFLPPPKIFPRGNRQTGSTQMLDGVNSAAPRWGTDALQSRGEK